MKTIDELLPEIRARERDVFNRNSKTYLENMQRQLEEKGYFTAGILEDEPLEAPYVVLLHTLPFEGDDRMFHNHSCFELVYVYRGSCRNLRRGYEVTLHQGDLLLMNPHAIHCLCTDSDEDVIFNFLIPEGAVDEAFPGSLSDNPISDFFMDYLHHIRTGPDFLVIGGEQDDALDDLIQRIIVEYHERLPGCNTVLRAGLAQLFVYMARRYSRSIQDLPLQGASRLVRNMMLYIAQNAATVTLSDAARAYAYHEKHISRLMKKELGLSFTQFLQLQRLRNAAQLLAHTNMSVVQVSREVGYQNVSHFYELFEDRYAMTPAAWRAANHGR